VASGGATRTVDARPSDALNLAVLLGRPVRVARAVLEAVRPAPSEPDTAVLTASGIVDELLARHGAMSPVRRRARR